VPLQQPLGHELASQTHWPVLVLHSSLAPHATHVAPPAPHEAFDSLESASHVEPLQQPAQAPPPQVHIPLEQAPPLAHAVHAAPAVPHWLDDCDAYATHVPPLQHPLGHEVVSQTHCPVALLHSCPAGHAAQLPPPVPQEPFDSDAYASHVPLRPPMQQPFGHVLTSHEQSPSVLSQRPFAQAAHALPPEPHSAADCEEDGTHVLPLQQPLGQEVASQTHCPVVLLHSCPVTHDPHAAPPVPQELLDSSA
jgi:hypothetical protein